jgi:glutathione S-transferase
MITISGFRWVPPFARGLVRDLRVRWALEEAGLPYRVTLLKIPEHTAAENRARQPFGQVPWYEEDGLVLFESGAMVLHVAEKTEALLPRDPAGRARAIQWVFAALNSLEVVIQPLASIDLFFKDQEWAKLRRPDEEKNVQRRLGELAARLGDREYLDGSFTCGDLMMATVLQISRNTGLVAAEPKLDAYLKRCTARPAYQRALAAQMGDFRPD